MTLKLDDVEQLLAEAGLSPESLAKMMDISNMTVRRWIKQCKEQKGKSPELPPLYQNSLQQVIYQLVLDGKLGANSKSAQRLITKGETPVFFAAGMRSLGFDSSDAMNADLRSSYAVQDQAGILRSMAALGAKPEIQEKVRQSRKLIHSFKALGKTGTEQLNYLLKLISLPGVSVGKKALAYGSLFYLINPFDLIPDYIVTIGLLDDFAIVGIVYAYLIKSDSIRSG